MNQTTALIVAGIVAAVIAAIWWKRGQRPAASTAENLDATLVTPKKPLTPPTVILQGIVAEKHTAERQAEIREAFAGQVPPTPTMLPPPTPTATPAGSVTGGPPGGSPLTPEAIVAAALNQPRPPK